MQGLDRAANDNELLIRSSRLHEILAGAACVGLTASLAAMFFFTLSGTKWLH